MTELDGHSGNDTLVAKNVNGSIKLVGGDGGGDTCTAINVASIVESSDASCEAKFCTDVVEDNTGWCPHPLCAGTKRGTTDCSKCDQVLVEREGKGDSNVTATNRSLENAFPYFNDAETCVCVVAHGSNFHEDYGGEIYLTDLGDCAFIYGYNNRIHASPPRVSVIRRRVRSGETTRLGRSSQRDPPSLSRRETEATTSSRSWMGNVMKNVLTQYTGETGTTTWCSRRTISSP